MPQIPSAKASSVITSGEASRPTHARIWVIVFSATLAALSYIDRVAISQAAPSIARDLHLSKTRMGTVFGAFILGYALFEIPGAWLADCLGPRKVLLRIVSWWSVFTAITGWATGFRSMVGIRFLFGVGEAGCFPAITKTLSTWLPRGERSRVQGVLWTVAHWSGAITPPLVAFMLGLVSWPLAFVLLGALGVIWLVPFASWYRDNPANHRSVNKPEFDLLGEATKDVGGYREKVPWALILRSSAVWLLTIQYFCLWFSGYFFFTWLPTYLQEFYKLSAKQSAKYAALTLFNAGVGALFSGHFTEYLARRLGSTSRARRLVCSVGFIGAAVFLALSIKAINSLEMIGLISVASFCHDLVVPPSWATCMDIGGKFSGSVAGVMNLFGNLAGVASSILGGYILQRTGANWHLLIGLLACVYGVGGLFWLRLDSSSSITQKTQLM